MTRPVKKTQNKQSKQIEQFLDQCEQVEAADDVPLDVIKSGEVAYQEYLEGHDPGISLEELKAKLACKSGATSS